jgi:hypothetical protein
MEDNKSIPPTIIFFDWDDTILPLSWLSRLGYKLSTDLIDEETINKLKKVEGVILQLFKLAIEYSTIYIVTNAEENWVQMSGAKFLPSVASYLHTNNNRIKVISARSTYERTFPNLPVWWKYFAMIDSIPPDFKQSERKQIFSIGDSHYEREAVMLIKNNIENTFIKSIKMVEGPSCDQLMEQIKLIEAYLKYIMEKMNHMNLKVVITDTTTDIEEEPNKEESDSDEDDIDREIGEYLEGLICE